MKEILIALTVLMVSHDSQSQLIRGSVKKNADPNKIDIVFKPDYSGAPGEYFISLQFALAIPSAGNGNVTATAVGVNTFSNMGTLAQAPVITDGAEQIYTWIFTNPEAAKQSWTAGVEFVGVTVTFSSTSAAAVGKMVDFTNSGGGKSGFIYFSESTTRYDPTAYGDLFYSIPGQSFLGNYPNGNQFVQTGR